MLRAHVAKVAPAGVRVEVEFLHGADAVTVDATGPEAEAALAAFEDVWGVRGVRIRTGGSIPIVGTFAQVLQVPVLLLGFGLEDDRLHSPNEKFNISTTNGDPDGRAAPRPDGRLSGWERRRPGSRSNAS